MTNMATYLASRPDAGASQDNDAVMVLRSSTWMKGSPGRIGWAPYKAIVWDDVPNAKKFYNNTTDRGYILGSEGIDNSIIQVPNYVTTQINKDPLLGLPYFYVLRTNVGMVFVNGAPGTNLRPGPDALVADRNPLATQSQLTSLTGAVVGDCAFVTADNRYYNLVTSPPTTLANWTALPVGAPGLMTVVYTFEGDIQQDGMPVMCIFTGPNKLVVG